MLLKGINVILMLVAVFMGLKQGWAMLSGKPEMLNLFGKWDFTKTGVAVLGLVTALSAVLIIFPKTFVWGNFLMAATILLIICFHLLDKDLKGVGVELPFLLLNLIIIYLQHPFKNGL
ncbi:DoxX family protein [Dyadobacter sp. BHUBP1]|uniref:DoxX family protein n=1 Tax=Dyadobacter sp. BHUBP1 TaxID=3424178 RepID=UPI003D32572E